MSITVDPLKGAQLHNRWCIGDLPRLLQQYEQKEINSEYDANELLTMTDADLAFGKRLLSSIDSAVERAKRYGVNRDSMEEIKTITGAFPVGESARRLLTNNFSRNNQKETLVALEAASGYGRVALLVLLVTALIKIVSWIVSGGHGFSSSGNGNDGTSYKEDAQKELEDMAREDYNILDTLQVTTIKQAYARALKDKKTIKDMTTFNTNVAYLDKVFAELKAEDYLNKLAECIGKKSPFTELMTDMTTNVKSQSEILRRAVERLLSLGVTNGVYKADAATRAWEALPSAMQASGTLIPNEVHYVTYNRTMGILADAIKGIAVSFRNMRDLPQLVDAYNKPQPNSSELADRKLGLEQFLDPYCQACRSIISDVIVPSATVLDSRDTIIKNGSALFPMVFASQRAVRELRDWTSAISIDTEGGREICLATVSNIFGFECVEQDLNQNRMSNDDAIKLLAVIVNLGSDALTARPDMTNLSKCEKLLKELETAKSNIEAWGRDMGRVFGPEDSARVAKEISSSMIRQVSTEFAHDAMGNGLAKQLFMSGEDFYTMVGSMFNIAKVVCRAGTLLQAHVNKTSNNPFLRKTKK